MTNERSETDEFNRVPTDIHTFVLQRDGETWKEVPFETLVPGDLARFEDSDGRRPGVWRILSKPEPAVSAAGEFTHLVTCEEVVDVETFELPRGGK